MNQNYCLHPVIVDEGRVFPCGKCPVCRMKYRKQMALRIYMEQAIEKPMYSYFVTLTYNAEFIPVVRGRQCFDKLDLQRFLDTLRHKLRVFGFSLRYFGTCEYGEEGYRPHYHFIFFLYGDHRFGKYEFNDCVCGPSWSRGFTTCSHATLGRIMYCTAYALKDDEALERDWRGFEEGRPFRLFSLRPGLGLTDNCINWWSQYISNDGNVRNTLSTRSLYRSVSTGVPIGIKKKLSEYYPDLHESLKEANMRFFEESLSQLLENASKYGSARNYTNKCGVDPIDYTPDNEIKAFRKALRVLRKQQTKGCTTP